MDELRTRIAIQCEIRECCALIITETWLSDKVPDSALLLLTHTVYQGDHTSASGKTRGGGVCVYVNNRWCVDVRVFGKYCSVDIKFLMVKCRPIYLPREFSTVFLLAVFILPEADHMTTLGIFHGFISR